MKYDEVEGLFDWVGCAQPLEHCAYLNRRTGDMYITSETGDSEDLPDDLYDNDDYLEIPHPIDLDLGRRLVLEFVAARLPGDFERVRGYFSRPGAFARFKDLLSDRSALSDWYEHEADERRATILLWCEENGVALQS